MRRSPRINLVLGFGSAVAIATAGLTAQQSAGAGPRFDISFTQSARAEPVTGRVYVAISRTNDRPPIQQADNLGVPIFGRNVEALAPGAKQA